MGAGAVAGQQAVETGFLPAHSEIMSKVMTCESCAIQFTFFKRKKVCIECKRLFCSTCLPREAMLRDRRCEKCCIIVSGRFNRQLLQAWKVKDMRCFLDCHDIPTNTCREKHDLIDLLVEHYSRGSLLMSEHSRQQRVQQLAEHFRVDVVQDAIPAQGTDIDVTNDTSRDHVDVAHVPDEIPVQASPACQRMRLHQIHTREDIDVLTVRQLKEILANNFVDYKGCCEKTELVERVQRLWSEEQRNKEKADTMRENADKLNTTSSTEQELCKICMDATIDCVLLECGHMITCTACGKRLAECPVCRQYVVRVVHTFRS